MESLAQGSPTAGRAVAQVAADLDLSDQPFYNWRRPGTDRRRTGIWSVQHEQAELVARGRRLRSWRGLYGDPSPGFGSCSAGGEPKRQFEGIEVMAHERLPVRLAARVLGVSESGYYQARGREPSRRAVRHAWLTGQIQAVHAASRGV